MADEKVALDNGVQKQEMVTKIKSYGWGIRHLQAACMMLNMITLMMVRASMGIAVLAMSDTKRNSTDIEVYDWNKQTQSIILSSFFWGYVVMQIPAGILSKRFGGKITHMIALFVNGLVCLLVPTLAALGGWLLVCAARATIGLSQAFLFPGTHTLLGQWLPDSERTSCTGTVFGGAKVGTIIAMAISGVLADSVFGWKSIFYTMGGIVFVNLMIWYFVGASCPREHPWISVEEKKYIETSLNVSNSKKPPKTPWKHILRSKPVWVLLAPQFGFAVSYTFFLIDMPTYLEKGMGISLKSSALLSTLPYIGMFLGGTGASYISQKLCNKGLLALTSCRKLFQSISLFGAAAGLVVLSFLGPENRTMAIVMLIGCLTLVGCSLAGFVVNQLDLTLNYAGVIMSLLNFISTIGCAALPIVTSAILQNDPANVGRWHIVFLMIAGICVFSASIYLIFGTAERQPWDDVDFLVKQSADAEESKPVLEDTKGCQQEKICENKEHVI